MRTAIRVLLVSGLLVTPACTEDDDTTERPPTPTSVDEPDAAGVDVPTESSDAAASDPVGEAGRVAGETTTSIGDSDPVVGGATSVPGGAPPPTAGGGESLGPLGDAELDVDTDEGTVQIGDAEVPAGLDAGFPLPEDLAVQLASETTTDIGFSGTTAGSIGELTEFYATELPQAGYTITESQIVEGVLAVFTFEGRDRFGQVAISETPGEAGSTVLVTIGDGAGQEATVSG